MKDKRVLVIGITLILLALCATMAFAEEYEWVVTVKFGYQTGSAWHNNQTTTYTIYAYSSSSAESKARAKVIEEYTYSNIPPKITSVSARRVD